MTTILPLQVFLGSVACAAIYEYVIGFICHRFQVSIEKEIWTFLYWLTLGMLGMLCGVIPPFHNIKEWQNWLPFVFVMAVHFCSACMGYDSSWMFFGDDGSEASDADPRNRGPGGDPKPPCKKGHPKG